MRNRYLVMALIAVVIAGFLVANINCAAIFDGTKKPGERGDIMWGYVVLDVLFTGAIGIIIDFASGAIYKRTTITSDIEQDMKTKLANNMPVYRVTEDKVFSVNLSNEGSLVFSEIAKSSLSPKVLLAIENARGE